MFSRGRNKTPKGLELLLLEDPLTVLSCFSQMKSDDYGKIGEAIGTIFLTHQRSADLLHLCAIEEIYSTARTEQLLRQDSVYIEILQQFVKSRGRNWRYQTLRKPLRRIIHSDYSIEIDKMRLAANEDLSINRNNLEDTIRSVLDPIFDHPEGIPEEIGALCRFLFQLTDKKFPGKGYKVISGSLFLRFICPFIGSPKSWHLLTRHEIKPNTRRKLILIAKVVQGIANENTEFNEQYMNQIQDILEEYISKLHVFLDRLIKISPSLEAIQWGNLKEKRANSAIAAQTLKEFFIEHHHIISDEIIAPLSNIYDRALLFGKRLELLLFDNLPPEGRFIVNEIHKATIQAEVSGEIKELRKEKGKNIWQKLLHDIVDLLSSQEEMGNPMDVLKFQIVHHYEPVDYDIGEANKSFAKGFKIRRRFRNQFERNPHTTNSVRLSGPPIKDVYKPSQSLMSKGEVDTSVTDLSDFPAELSEIDDTLSLSIWLQKMDIAGCYKYFYDAGITEVQQIKPMTDQQLVDIGITQEALRQQIQEFAKDPTNTTHSKRKKRKSKRHSKHSKHSKHSSRIHTNETKQEPPEVCA